MEDPVKHTAHTQCNVKHGLKLFGERGVDAVLKEVQQLHDQDVVEPLAPNILTKEDKRSALSYLMFLNEKQCGKIKGRGCADGHKLQAYLTKEESSSPTVSLEALMLSCAIDAKEGHNIAMADIPRAFMQTDMDQTVYM
jgi:hypothetical protein